MMNVKLEMEKCRMTCVGETQENNVSKSQEFSNCNEPLSQKRINGRYQTFR